MRGLLSNDEDIARNFDGAFSSSFKTSFFWVCRTLKTEEKEECLILFAVVDSLCVTFCRKRKGNKRPPNRIFQTRTWYRKVYINIYAESGKVQVSRIYTQDTWFWYNNCCFLFIISTFRSSPFSKIGSEEEDQLFGDRVPKLGESRTRFRHRIPKTGKFKTGKPYCTQIRWKHTCFTFIPKTGIDLSQNRYFDLQCVLACVGISGNLKRRGLTSRLGKTRMWHIIYLKLLHTMLS